MSSTSHSICRPRCGGILRHGYTEQFLGVSVRDKMLKIHPQLPNLWLKMKRLALYASRLHRVGASETTYWSVTYDFLLTFHSNHGPISYSFRDKRWFQWIIEDQTSCGMWSYSQCCCSMQTRLQSTSCLRGLHGDGVGGNPAGIPRGTCGFSSMH